MFNESPEIDGEEPPPSHTLEKHHLLVVVGVKRGSEAMKVIVNINKVTMGYLCFSLKKQTQKIYTIRSQEIQPVQSYTNMTIWHTYKQKIDQHICVKLIQVIAF